MLDCGRVHDSIEGTAHNNPPKRKLVRPSVNSKTFPHGVPLFTVCCFVDLAEMPLAVILCMPMYSSVMHQVRCPLCVVTARRNNRPLCIRRSEMCRYSTEFGACEGRYQEIQQSCCQKMY